MGLTSQLALLRQVKMMTHQHPQMDDNGAFSVFISEIYNMVDDFLREKDPMVRDYFKNNEKKHETTN